MRRTASGPRWGLGFRGLGYRIWTQLGTSLLLPPPLLLLPPLLVCVRWWWDRRGHGVALHCASLVLALC